MRTHAPWILILTLMGICQGKSAAAYCRSYTTPVPADFDPQRRGGCWTQGFPLWWHNACVGYSLNKKGSSKVDFALAGRAISTGFAQWVQAQCGASTSAAGPSLQIQTLAQVECDQVTYSSTAPNQNVILFRDDAWPHNDPNNTLALTTMTFDLTTGEIFDADMEINTAEHPMVLAQTIPAGTYDFASVITHEAGHFLGLAHSDLPTATMFARYDAGSTSMRTLSPDDVAGICTIYPSGGTRSVSTKVNSLGFVKAEACDATPRHGFGSACPGKGAPTPTTSPPATNQSGCSCSLGPEQASLSPALPLALLGGVGLWQRRRRPRPRDPR